jgi:Zn-dependent protease
MQTQWKIGRLRSMPIYLHWTVLLGLPWMYFQYRGVAATSMAFVAFVVLMLLHELGHAGVAIHRGVPVHEIRLFFIHGQCTHDEPYYETDHILIAWGGVAAQTIVLIVALAVGKGLLWWQPLWYFQLAPLFNVFVETNVCIIAFNLIPLRGLDGEVAWRALPYARDAVLSSRWVIKARKLSDERSTAKRQALEAESRRLANEFIEELQRKK